ncbi:MAG: DNA gyrase subunit A [Eubacteriales bacterium]|nr:DNA gyrase subunit A [Eubacteriales bacterium]
MPNEAAVAAPNEKLNVDELFREHVNNVVPVDLDEEMRRSFMEYAMSVISDRALPDARDGLKPVHRRILYSMFTQGFTPDKPYRKCATTVGDVLGRFHPHGDIAAYDALVRLAQDFSMRHILVDGHGNFGSRDGDSPAAYRYTEARLTKLAMEMMRDINKQTVDFRPNYDEHEMEPVVLPSHFPNLLVNGSQGIAVGMATSIPPHNLGECIDAAVHLLENPEADIDALLKFVQAPDFPTGGTILGLSGVRDCYRSGKGRIVVRANSEIEEMGGQRQRIVIHDLPYLVNKARLLEKISEQVKNKKIEGISHVRDESDRNDPVRIVIELKRDANANLTLNQLYKFTQLQDTFSANMMALVEDENGHYVPRNLNLKELLTCYTEHQKQVFTRKTKFDLEKAEARKHIVEGLRIAIDFIDEVIRIIRASKTEAEAKLALSERFNFSERQAQHIVDMRLGRLTGLERDKLEAEYADLINQIAHYQSILNDDSVLVAEIVRDLIALKDRFADERRTKIDPFGVDGIADESLIKREHVVLTMTRFGYIKRIPLTTYQMQHRGGRGISAMSTRDEDMVDNLVFSSTHDFVLFFTNTGRVFKKKAYEIPEGSRQSRGMAIVNLLQLEADEKIINFIPLKSFDDELDLVIATRSGLIKKTELASYRNINNAGIIAINLREDDRVVAVRLAKRDVDYLLMSSQGKSIRFSSANVRETGRNTFGVRGMRLAAGDEVIAVIVVSDEGSLFTATEFGYGKRTAFEAFRRQGRGGQGIIAYRLSTKTGRIVACAAVREDEDIMLMNSAGIVIRIDASEVSEIGRATSGVSVMRCDDGVKLVDLAVVPREVEAEDFEEDEISVELESPDPVQAAESIKVVDSDENQAVYDRFFEKTRREDDDGFAEDWNEDLDEELRRRRAEEDVIADDEEVELDEE